MGRHAKQGIDWERIEGEYRTGQLSLRTIGNMYGISESSVRSKAKAEGWPRDLVGKVRTEISARLVRGESRASKKERDVIEDAAARGVSVVLQHREVLARLHAIVDRLAERLERHLDGDGDLARGETPGGLLESLARSVDKLIVRERQAFSLDAKEGTGSQATIQFLDYRPTRAGDG